MLEPVDQQDLQRAGDRDGAERAEHAGHLGPDQDRDQHDERRELHGAPVDERLEHVVLDLLVEDEEHEQHDPGLIDVRKPTVVSTQAGERRARERDQVEDRHDQPERERERHAHDQQDDRRARPRRSRDSSRLPVT